LHSILILSRAIHTPGHTTDHLCYWLEEEQALFAGDTILGQGTTEFEDLFDYINSLQLILNLSPKIIYPGHGPVIENPREAIEHYLAHRQQRNEQILDALKQSDGGLEPEQITRLVYKVKLYSITQWQEFNIVVVKELCVQSRKCVLESSLS
jgi:endoribonuclease LACTB2